MEEISLEILKELSKKHGKFNGFKGGPHNYTTGQAEWVELTFVDGTTLFFDYMLGDVGCYLPSVSLAIKLYQLKVNQHKIIEWYNIVNTGTTGE